MPTKRTTPKMQRRAAELRGNQTEAEARLWAYLRAHRANGVHFRRQHAIGNYIVDFCAPRVKLIIEVDGGQHIEQEEYDRNALNFLNHRAILFCASGITKSQKISKALCVLSWRLWRKDISYENPSC